MRIRTQFVIITAIYCLILIAIAVSAIVTNQRMKNADEQETIAASLALGASDLSYLSHDYLIYREDQQFKRWLTRFASFSSQVASLRGTRPEHHALILSIEASRKRLKEVFDSVTSAAESSDQNRDAILAPAALQVSWSRMSVQSQALISDSLRLVHSLHEEMNQLTEARTLLIYVAVALLGLFLLSGYMLTYRRILKSIIMLERGAARIGSGDLDFRIAEKRKDEIGDLSRSFNQMTANLKTVTASKEDLEREIRERQQAEEALRASEDKFRSIFETSASPIIISTAKDGRLINVNSAFTQLLGYNREKVIGRTTSEIGLLEGSEERERIVGRIAAKGRVEGEELTLKTQTGEAMTGLISATLMDLDGERCIVSSFMDITERKQAEERVRESEATFRAICELNPFGAWECDSEGAITYLSKSWLEMVGMSLDECRRLGWTERYAPGEGKRMLNAWQQCRQGGGRWEYEHQIRDKDGLGRWVLSRGFPIQDSDGRIIKWVGLNIDITEMKRAEEALKRLNQNLEMTVEERTRELYAANQALEARAAQLRALAGELTTAEQRERRSLAKLLHDGLQQYLVAARMRTTVLIGEIVDAATKESAVSVEGLLTESISVSRSLATELCPPVLDGGILAGLEWLSKFMASKHGLNVSLVTELDSPVLAEDVKVFLFESVRELLLNVVKHAKTLSAKVHLKEEGSELRITISDRGAGCDACALQGKDGGGGFGLFSIRERIGLVGGRFEIDSSLGMGARFSLIVPLVVNEAIRPVSDNQSSQCSQHEPMQPEGKIRILLVDDHSVIREGLAQMLRAEKDFEIVGQAQDGKIAVEMAEKLHPSVILMDINMPNVDGITATRVIAQRHPDIHVVGLSFYKSEERATEMIEAGATFYISKTAPSDELKQAIRSCVGEEFKKAQAIR